MDILRLLTSSQNEASSHDVFEFWSENDWPVEAAEYMFSLDLIPPKYEYSDGESYYPPLATALRRFGKHLSEWERFLRFLLRKKYDLQSPLPRNRDIEKLNSYVEPLYAFKVSEHGTPLDELFRLTSTPFD